MDTETLEDTSAWLKTETAWDNPDHDIVADFHDVLTPKATKRRCTGTNKAGNPCSMPPRLDAETCLVHSLTPTERSEQAKRGNKASLEVRKASAEKRQERVEASKHSLTEWFSIAAGEQAEALARKAVSQALDGDVRALSIVLERVEGKVADHIVTTAGDPFELDLKDLARWLETAPAETVDSA